MRPVGEVNLRLMRAVRFGFPRFWRNFSIGRRFVKGFFGYGKCVKKDVNFRRCALAARYYEKEELRSNWIMYESYNGRDFGCNPYAIFVYLLDHPEFQHLHHFIAVDDPTNPVVQRYSPHPRVTILKSHSRQYIKVAESCKYFINNVSFKPYLIKKEGQVYVTTWHSTLLKKLAFDCGRPWESKNVARALLASDYFVSPNRFTTERLFASHRVDQWFTGRVIEAGYPRNDMLWSDDVEALRNRLKLSGDAKLVLYAPTWRGNYSPENTVEETLTVVRYLKEWLPDCFTVLAKFHTMVYPFLDAEALQYAAPRDFDTNAILGATDILVTDYSGIFFDFLITGRPVLFYVPDRKQYEAEKKGFYLDLDTLPGPIHEEIELLVRDIQYAVEASRPYSDAYQKYRERFVCHDDGCATKRIVGAIFKQEVTGGVDAFPADGRHEILLYPANLAGNGVTESCLALLDNIDYQRFKVALMLPTDGKNRAAQERINENVSVFYQSMPDAFLRTEYAWHQVLMRWGVGSPIVVPERAYARTMRRIFGDRSFSTVINFNGYFPGAALKLATWAKDKRKVIYLHNDLEEDRQIKHPQLHAVFSMYSMYDELFCVSADSLHANREKVSRYVQDEFGEAIAGKFSVCMNPIVPEKIRMRASGTGMFSVNDRNFLALEGGGSFIRGVVCETEKTVNFVSVGRLSPEKNHERLLRAFKNIVKECGDVFLYVIGTGPLEKRLLALTKSLGLEERVAFTGFVNNPLQLVQACDCFVLSSDIEGQPITVLEALTLGVPIISTDIPGPRGLLEEFGGLLVEPTVEGVASGMKQFVSGAWQPSSAKFVGEEYVELVMQQFYEGVVSVRAPLDSTNPRVEVRRKYA